MGHGAAGPLPRTLRGRYRLTEVLGRGTRATVYRAEDLLLGRPVAVKVLSPGAAEADPERVQAEARRLAALTMHGLVTVFDVDVDRVPGEPAVIFLVLELVEAVGLRQALEHGPLPPRHVTHMGMDLAEALQYMHDHGVVHGDLAPSNVLLLDHGAERRPRVKLGDYGLAAIVGPGAGTYLSPEQRAGSPASAASDVYALGLVLLQSLTGRVAPDALEEVAGEAWREPLAAMLDADPSRRPSAAALVATFGRMVLDGTARHRGRAAEERERLAAVHEFGVLDTPPDQPFDRIAQLAARVLDTAAAGIGIFDADRIWFKSRQGGLPAEVPAGDPLHAALTGGGATVVVEDALQDGPLASAPLVADGFRFAAAAPILTAEGARIGFLAVYDSAPRRLDPAARETLADLAAIVLHELELRRAARRAALARRR